MNIQNKQGNVPSVDSVDIEACGDSVIWHRGQRIVSVNDEACRALGYSRSELQSMTLDQIDSGTASTDRESLLAQIENKGSAVLDTFNLRKDGSRFPVELTVTAHRMEGEVLFCGIARDISDRLVSERHLRESRRKLQAKVEELRRTERRYNLAIEGGRLGTFEWIPAEGGGEVSDSLYRLFGQTPGSVAPTYAAFAAQTHPDDLRRIERVFGVARRTRRAVAQEARIIWPDGSVHWIDIRARFAFDQHGEAIRLDGVMVDIDDKKTAEEILDVSEQKLKLALDAGRLGTWEWDTRTGEVVCSQRAYQIFGYRPDQIDPTFDVFTKHLHPDDAAQVLESLAQSRELRTEHQLEHRIVTFDGRDRWIEVCGRFSYDALNNPTLMRGVIADVTKRKQADEELQLRRFAVDVAGEAMLTLRMDGQIVDANKVACERLGYTRDELLRKKLTQSSSPEFDALVHSLLKEQYQVIPARHRRKDGGVIDVELSAKMFSYKGQDYVCVTARDVTKLKRAENHQRELDQQLVHMNRLASMGELASAIAHELNQPLAVVTNNAAVLQLRIARESIEVEEAVKLTDLISSQAVLAGDIVRRMRSFCLNRPAQHSRVQVAELIEESIQLLEPELRHSGIRFETRFTAVPDVHVDRVQIQQVLVNLVNNSMDAMKSTDRADRALNIRTWKPNGQIVRISVSDSGPGIPPDRIEEVFMPFKTTKSKGMGMGLAISRSIVEAHHGQLTFRQSITTGATFYIDLPIQN